VGGEGESGICSPYHTVTLLGSGGKSREGVSLPPFGANIVSHNSIKIIENHLQYFLNIMANLRKHFM
jgi:hypothetical protein